eukprot:894514-Amphidinium_carterae.1
MSESESKREWPALRRWDGWGKRGSCLDARNALAAGYGFWRLARTSVHLFIDVTKLDYMIIDDT